MASKDDCDSILKNELPIDCQPPRESSNVSSLNSPFDRLCLRISVCLHSLLASKMILISRICIDLVLLIPSYRFFSKSLGPCW